MNTVSIVAVWVLITFTHVNPGTTVTYSPPLADLESCRYLADTVHRAVYGVTTQCVQVKVVK
jgi:hypothetical protein